MSISWENAVETLEFTVGPAINNKIKAVVTGLPKSISNLFLEFLTDHDKKLVADFLDSSLKQENISINTKRVYLIALAYLARWAKKPLETITANDLYDYVNSFQPKKSNEEDPDQSWISTQRTLCLPLLKFFKWLLYPELTTQQRKRLPRDRWPDVLRRFELATRQTGSPRTPVKDSDKWDDKDIAIFLKYCTDYPRLRLYHVMAWETSARPSELLQLKIGDIEDNIQLDEDGAPCAVFKVGRYGKTKYSFRDVGITKLSLQYYNRYLPSHPDSTNRKAYIFTSLEYSALGRNQKMVVDSAKKNMLKESVIFQS
jgi:integrase